MKFVHLAASLLLLNSGVLFSQSGYNGPAPLPSPSPEPQSSALAFQEELEVDNVNRLQSPEEQRYFDELTSCLLIEKPEQPAEADRLTKKASILERKILLALDEQAIGDPEAEEDGMERLAMEINTQQLGQIALLEDQLSTVMMSQQSQQEEDDYLQSFLQEDLEATPEPVHWLVQAELGQIR